MSDFLPDQLFLLQFLL